MLNRNFFIPVLAAVLIVLAGAANVKADDAQKININTASAEQLTQLKGIGANAAANIIAYREKNGPFKRPEDLIQVPRIGQKTFEKNKDLIVIEITKKKQSK